MLFILSCVSLYMLLSAPSVDMDGSLGDSDGIKDPGSKKRYTILFTFHFSLNKLDNIPVKKRKLILIKTTHNLHV